MFIRFSTLLPVAAFAAVVSAATTTQCNTGSLQCCGSTYDQASTTITDLFGGLGIVLPNIQGLVGLGCSPISGTGATCTQQPVCCSGNTFSGLINVGCDPINLNA